MATSELPRTSGIYQIVNNVTEKRYIGYASNVATRINGHKHDLTHSKHPNDYLQKAWCKYGPNNFSFEVLELCDKNQLCSKEDYWVKILMTENSEYGYNLKPTDPLGRVGHHIETIEKMSRSNKGRKPSPQAYAARAAIPMTPEHKELLRVTRSIVDYKKLHREKRGKAVIDMVSGKIYQSLAELCELLNTNKGSLSRVLSGARKNNTNYRYL